MLVNCKPGCSGKKATTEASLDIETNCVYCNYCGDEIQLSSFVKNSMKQRGDIKKVAKKPFQFKCLTCTKEVEVVAKGKKVCGKDCQKDCKFNISDYAVYALNLIQKENKKLDAKEEEIQDE